MKSCCKSPSNWRHDGSRNKQVIDRGDVLQITSQNYLTCKICQRKLSMLVDKTVLEAVRKERVTHERA